MQAPGKSEKELPSEAMVSIAFAVYFISLCIRSWFLPPLSLFVNMYVYIKYNTQTDAYRDIVRGFALVWK